MLPLTYIDSPLDLSNGLLLLLTLAVQAWYCAALCTGHCGIHTRQGKER